MYFSFWQEHLDEFLGLMQNQGYHPKTIAAHKRFALSLVTHEDQVGWHSYEDARTYISSMERLTDKARWFKLSIINKLEDYHLYGILPVHRIEKNHKPVIMPSQSIGELNLFPMNEQIDDFSAFFMQQGKSDAIILSVRRTVARIIKLSGIYKWDSYQDIKDWYSTNGLSDKYLRKIYTIIDQMEYWQVNGTLAGWEDFKKPNTSQHRHVTVARTRMTIEPSLGQLDLSYVQVHMDGLLDRMRVKGYNESSLEKTRNDLNRVIMLSRSIRWDSIEDILAWNENRPVSQAYKRTVSKSLERMEHWLTTGDIPDHPSVQKALDAGIISIGKLDLSFWADHLEKLLKYMEKHGYCNDYRLKIYFHTRRLAVLSQTISWDSYEDIWKWCLSHDYGERYLHDIRAIIGILEEFHIYGIMPNNRTTQNPLCPRENAYSKLVPEYKQMVDFAYEAEERRGLKPGTLKCTKAKASSFLYSLQSRGADRLKKVTETDVLAYFFEDGKHLRGRSTASRISLFFRICVPLNPEECRRIGIYIPKFHSSRKTIQYLTKDESDRFRDALGNAANGLSYKERAIGSLVFYTGMRGSDVTSLTLGAIDLRHRTIQFVQEKTGTPVILPLSTVVGNAIYDYCVLERPNTATNEFLFLSESAPHNRLGKGGIEWAVTKVMNAAGIRQNEGDRKGGHIFRHRAASTMAENNIPSPVISAILGHSSPKSLDAYLYADMEHLKECALGLEKFPLAEEVISLV